MQYLRKAPSDYLDVMSEMYIDDWKNVDNVIAHWQLIITIVNDLKTIQIKNKDQRVLIA